MGTRFRTLLAPVGVSTGDGRRFADGAISLVPAPFALEWVRERQGGHDGAVSIGSVEQTFRVRHVDSFQQDGRIRPCAVMGSS